MGRSIRSVRWFSSSMFLPISKRVSASARFPIYNREDRFGDEVTTDMEVIFVGTSSTMPTDSRGASCSVLRFNSECALIDAGEGTQRQLNRSKLHYNCISKIFITHLHGDHIFGLPAVLCSIGQALRNQDSSDIVDIYGPTGIRDFIRVTLQTSQSRIAAPHRIHELKGIPLIKKGFANNFPSISTQYTAQYGERPGSSDIHPDERGAYDVCAMSTLSVRAAPLKHSIPCVGYVFSEVVGPGGLNPEVVIPFITRNAVRNCFITLIYQ